MCIRNEYKCVYTCTVHTLEAQYKILNVKNVTLQLKTAQFIHHMDRLHVYNKHEKHNAAIQTWQAYPFQLSLVPNKMDAHLTNLLQEKGFQLDSELHSEPSDHPDHEPALQV